MGKLRKEPKQKNLLTKAEFDQLLSILQEAKKSSEDNYLFYDLEDNEKPAKLKKAFNYVARKAGIDVTVRQVRGKRSLSFNFRKGRSGAPRMSAEESRTRILNCLKDAKSPLKKRQIIHETGVSPSTWNIRIKELLDNGKVTRHGNRRDTTYTIAP